MRKIYDNVRFMKNLNLKKGFTLIELLVVVAIIGILSSVVLAALNNARGKGTDSAIKSAMAGARGQAELYYSNNNYTYTNVCLLATTGGIYPIILSAAKQLGSTNVPVTVNTTAYAWSASGAANSSMCHENGNGWAAITSLKNPTSANGGWCVDSNGTAKESTSLGASVFTCP